MRMLLPGLLAWGVLLAPAAPHAPPVRKLALIITIGGYPAASGYAPINTRNDAELVIGALRAQQFDPADIVVLRDSAATREGILAAFAGLTDRAAPGDIVVIHYSGHGHRITDDNGDEIDGYDELLVPWGAPARVRAASYHGEQHLRDDEIGPLLERIRRKVGPTGSVTVFLDACYSGSATRGAGDEPGVRGMLEPIEVAGPRRARPAPMARGGDRALLDAESAAEAGAGSLVVISAAGFDQLAHETYDDAHRVVGSLSLAVSRTLSRLPPGATYRLLQERIAGAMAAMNLGDQRPQVEGDLDTPVLGGGLVAQQPYLRVSATRGDSLVVVPGGAAVGLLPGSRLALFPAGTADPASATARASAVVREAGPDEAVARITSGAGATGLRGSWAFVTEYAWTAEPLRLAIDPGLTAAEAAALRRAATPLAGVQLVSAQPDLRAIRAAGPGGGIRLRAEPGGAPAGGALRTAEPDFPAHLAAAVTGFQRVRLFRRLELADPAVAVRMELVPAEPRIDWTASAPQCRGTPPVLRPVPGTLTLRPREEYVLRFTHDGTEPAYLTVLDLTPDGRVEQVYPLPGAEGDDTRLEPGRSFTVVDVCFYAESAPGTEVLKLFASRRRLDFATALGGERGAPEVPGLGVNTHAVSFTVAPRSRAP